MNISAIGSSTALPATVPSRTGDAAPQASTGAALVEPSASAYPSSAGLAAVSEKRPPDNPTMLQALNEVREALAPVAQNLQFSVDEDSGRTVIKIVDSATDEVIKQIPSEEIIAIAKALDKLQGVLIRQQA